jgi:hypothetical protein
MSRCRLPIDTVLDEVVTTLVKAPAVVLQAPPGAGKTTRVPVALATIQLAAGDAGNQNRRQYLIRVRDQLQRIARSHLGPTGPASAPAAEVLAKAVLAAFPDRLARRRPGDRGRALMVGGRGICLDDRGEQIAQDLLMAVEVTAGGRGQLAEALVRRAVPVERSWLPETHQSRSVDSLFDNASQRVRTYDRQRWLDLVIADNECSPPDPDEVSSVLAEAAAADIKHALALDSQQVESCHACTASASGGLSSSCRRSPPRSSSPCCRHCVRAGARSPSSGSCHLHLYRACILHRAVGASTPSHTSTGNSRSSHFTRERSALGPNPKNACPPRPISTCRWVAATVCRLSAFQATKATRNSGPRQRRCWQPGEQGGR